MVELALLCPTTGLERPSAIEIEEACDNLDKRVSRDCDTWADVLELMIQELDKEASKAVPEPKVDA